MDHSSLLEDLREELLSLVKFHHVVALKTGTEIEDMSLSEISLLRKLTQEKGMNIVPLIVKIGGAEARNDIRQMLRLRVDMILAPMIESPYALRNFVETAEELMTQEKISCQLAINLETALALENLDYMLESESFSRLTQVTIGRGDLSKSMHLGVDDEEVMRQTGIALRKLKKRGVLTSVGGGLSLSNIAVLCRRLPSHRLNTRHVVLENNHHFRSQARQHLHAALMFECRLYQIYAQFFPERKNYYETREKILRERMEYLNVVPQVSHS
ncbi:MAG: aldolase/citrate lyase family protein [Leptospiraceae bacterium]|nr:aldolase/citrate lyase family protein [Leptospiraceae bacterium]MDW8307127.1 aldolase/citrate lyase family protein [Leptospiraceae bacterium]